VNASPSPNDPPILGVVGLTRRFGGLRALGGVDLAVARGERRAVIGPNGAGKTTLFSVIGGDLPPSTGQIFFKGAEVTGWQPYRLAEQGLARTFQRSNLFPGLSAFENVRLTVQRRLALSAQPLRRKESFGEVNACAAQLLDRVHLRDAARLARHLSHGEQRQLELAIALAGEPELLLLDEPTAGMSPAETEAMTKLLRALPSSLTLLIVEHDMDVVFALADRVTVLHHGVVLAEGSPDSVREDPAVREAYLGARS
jgi:branched-chain amino acid transport system ATP-binding protein